MAVIFSFAVQMGESQSTAGSEQSQSKEETDKNIAKQLWQEDYHQGKNIITSGLVHFNKKSC